MITLITLFRNRNFLLILSILLGLFIGNEARWTKPFVLPALALVMTISILGIPSSIFHSPRAFLRPTLVGLVMNYGLLSGLIFFLNTLLIQDASLSRGFILVLAVPPAVAVIPFTMLLKGEGPYSLIATIGCYLGALILMPLITIILLGPEFVDLQKVILIMVELIMIPLLISRFLRWMRFSEKIEPYKGMVTNWGFFLVNYTMVGLNRSAFLNHPLDLAPVALIGMASTFLIGYGIQEIGLLFRIEPKKLISIILLGSQKNTGLAAGLAITLFNEQTALPATVSTIFMIFYFIWLSTQTIGLKRKKLASGE